MLVCLQDVELLWYKFLAIRSSESEDPTHSNCIFGSCFGECEEALFLMTLI